MAHAPLKLSPFHEFPASARWRPATEASAGLHAATQRRPMAAGHMMFPSRTISFAINRPSAEVYRFLCDPANLGRWASGIIHTPLKQVGPHVFQTEFEGRVAMLHFSPGNPQGVIDLRVTGRGRADRTYFARVFANGDGAELCCTVLQGADESDAQFASECEWLRTDLQVLKSYFETEVV